MFIRSFVLVLVLAFSFAIVNGQAPDGPKPATATPKRNLPFSTGIDLQFLIKELARDMDINVLFDNESFRSYGRKVSIELKNVTSAEALDYILLQEGLFFEEAGPKTILVAIQAKQRGIPQIGVTVTPMRDQLAQYFGVAGGLLIDSVRDESPASKAGLKAGDVIVKVDRVSVKGALGILRAINDKKGSDVVLTVFRNRKSKAITVTPGKAGIGSLLQKS